MPEPGWAGLPPGHHVMGIVNVTPDSFSDGSPYPNEAIALAERMLADGAAIIDIGGESTRPGATPVTPAEEQRRILPVIEAIARQGARVSVDTRHAGTMERALRAGATIVNDVSGLCFDPSSAKIVSLFECPVILMHMRGTPEIMDGLAVYDDVVAEVTAELTALIERALEAGIERDRIAIDPGFGFAKDSEHNVALLRGLSQLVNLRCPIIAGISRKRFVGTMANVTAPSERDLASVVAGLYAVGQGASILRVHDVRSTVQALKVWSILTGLAGQG